MRILEWEYEINGQSRNIKLGKIEFSDNIILINGDIATGKTFILESIYKIKDVIRGYSLFDLGSRWTVKIKLSENYYEWSGSINKRSNVVEEECLILNGRVLLSRLKNKISVEDNVIDITLSSEESLLYLLDNSKELRALRKSLKGILYLNNEINKAFKRRFSNKKNLNKYLQSLDSIKEVKSSNLGLLEKLYVAKTRNTEEYNLLISKIRSLLDIDHLSVEFSLFNSKPNQYVYSDLIYKVDLIIHNKGIRTNKISLGQKKIIYMLISAYLNKDQVILIDDVRNNITEEHLVEVINAFKIAENTQVILTSNELLDISVTCFRLNASLI